MVAGFDSLLPTSPDRVELDQGSRAARGDLASSVRRSSGRRALVRGGSEHRVGSAGVTDVMLARSPLAESLANDAVAHGLLGSSSREFGTRRRIESGPERACPPRWPCRMRCRAASSSRVRTE